MRVSEILNSKKIVRLESDSNYTNVFFEDDSSVLVSYTQKKIIDKFKLKLKRVNRKVSVNTDFAKINGKQVTMKNKTFEFSRRMAKAIIFLIFPLVSFAQVAVADTVYECMTRPIIFSVMGNDTLLTPNSFVKDLTAPTAGSVVKISGNRLRYVWAPGTSIVTFNYNIGDLGGYTSNFATVRIFGNNLYHLNGVYSNAANATLNGCRIVNSGKFTITSAAKVKIESNTSVTFLAGTTIDAGAVVDIKIVRP